jgi:hypothetical protein
MTTRAVITVSTISGLNILSLAVLSFSHSITLRGLACIWLGLFLTVAGLIKLGDLIEVGRKPSNADQF